MYTLLIDSNKNLLTTKREPIYKGEKNASAIKILFPTEYNDLSPTLQIIYPDDKTGKIIPCVYENELYKNRLVAYVPIDEQLTAYNGDLQVWFTLLGDGQNKVVKTNVAQISILDHKGFTEVVPESDIDVMQKIVSLQTELFNMKKEMANNLEVNNEENTLTLKAGDKALATVKLPEEIEWSIGEQRR